MLRLLASKRKQRIWRLIVEAKGGGDGQRMDMNGFLVTDDLQRARWVCKQARQSGDEEMGLSRATINGRPESLSFVSL